MSHVTRPWATTRQVEKDMFVVFLSIRQNLICIRWILDYFWGLRSMLQMKIRSFTQISDLTELMLSVKSVAFYYLILRILFSHYLLSQHFKMITYLQIIGNIFFNPLSILNFFLFFFLKFSNWENLKILFTPEMISNGILIMLISLDIKVIVKWKMKGGGAAGVYTWMYEWNYSYIKH